VKRPGRAKKKQKMPRYINSLDKVVFSYLAAVTKCDFQYSEKTVIAKPLIVSPMIFRGFQCPENCGGCCPRFSLEYLPSEPRPEYKEFVGYEVSVNGKNFTMYHDEQSDHLDHHCRYLDKITGRCDIYPRRPFHCDFELLRVYTGKKGNRLTTQMFGRGWQFLRIDNQRGALCKITQTTSKSLEEVVRKLKRLKEWADHFQLDTWLPEIIEWVASGPHVKPLLLATDKQIKDSVKESLGVK
jgi:Fe-S-cluster containining protein